MLSTKQFVCGRSNATLSVLLLVSSTYISWTHAMNHLYQDTDVVDSKPVSFLKRAYKSASSYEVQEIVEVLKDPSYATWEEDRYRLFIGPPGTGKTTQALAVPVMANWHIETFVPADFQTKDRNNAADTLKEILGDVLKNEEKTVIVIDEVEGLLEYPEEQSNDNAATGRALWTFLDKLFTKNNTFFIGLTNDISKAAPQIKERFIHNMVFFENLIDPLERVRAFKSHLKHPGVRISDCCSHNFLTKMVGNTDRSHRNYRSIATLAQRTAKREAETGEMPVVTKEHIEHAVKIDKKRKKCSVVDFYSKQECSHVQRERHHDESMEQSKSQHEESLKQNQKHHEKSIKQGDDNHRQSVDQSYQIHALNLCQEILKSRHNTMLGGLSDQGVKDLIEMQPKAVVKHVIYNEHHGVIGEVKHMLCQQTWTETRKEIHKYEEK